MGAADDLRRRRATAQWLHRPASDPVAVVRHLVAVQAQDLRAAKLALRARGTGFTAADVDAALDAGALVVAWLNRGTLHLVCAEDLAGLLALTARPERTLRRLAQLGVRDPDRLLRRLPSGAFTRAEFAQETGTTGQQTPHLLALAALRGQIVAVGERRYGPAPAAGLPLDLGSRYAASHFAAAPEDLAHWAGIPVRQARSMLPGDVPPVEPAALPPRALGAFDPYLLGWKDRSFCVPPALAREVHPGGGLIRACVAEDGLVTGTWSGTPPVEASDVARFLDGDSRRQGTTRHG